jgi:hypothetical protein
VTLTPLRRISRRNALENVFTAPFEAKQATEPGNGISRAMG